MFNRKLIIILFFVLYFFNSNAQKFELGKVSMEELQEKFHSKDTSAVAAILFQTGNVSFPYEQHRYFSTTTVVKTKIKIYKKEGLENANQIINYYSGGNSTIVITFSNAITYNLINGKIEKTKLKDDGKFITNINKFWTQKTITMPNVKVGSIIEFQYTVTQSGIGTPMRWSFQKNIPVDYSEFITQIPEYFIYSKNYKGFIFPKTTILNILERSDYKETRTTYLAKNMPAMKAEKYVNNIENYTSSVTHELTATKWENFATGWGSIIKTIYDVDDFNKELNKNGYFEDNLKLVLNGLSKRDEIIVAVLDFVKKKVKWNKNSNFLCNYGVKNAYKEGIGNSAEINLMLTSMLRFAGIDASPILVSTRSNGLVLFPSISAFNYVICGVEIENDVILLDATENYSSLNILPLRDLNYKGRIIRKESSSSAEIDLTPKIISRNINNINYSVGKEGNVEGKIRIQYSDYCALDFREKNLTANKEVYLEKLESENNNIEINEYIRDNDLDLSKPIVENYSFKDTKSIEVISNKIYISPLLFLRLKENPFKQEKREYPVDFSYPLESKYYINIIIPEGFTIESIPTAVNLVTGDDIGAFKYVIGTTENKIQISVTFTINTAIVPADYYEVIKEFYQKMIDKQNEKIVLVKK